MMPPARASAAVEMWNSQWPGPGRVLTPRARPGARRRRGAPRWGVSRDDTEARDADGTFCPLAERLAAFDGTRAPDDLLEELREDLLAHADGTLGDDAALVALLRTVP